MTNHYIYYTTIIQLVNNFLVLYQLLLLLLLLYIYFGKTIYILFVKQFKKNKSLIVIGYLSDCCFKYRIDI